MPRRRPKEGRKVNRRGSGSQIGFQRSHDSFRLKDRDFRSASIGSVRSGVSLGEFLGSSKVRGIDVPIFSACRGVSRTSCS